MIRIFIAKWTKLANHNQNPIVEVLDLNHVTKASRIYDGGLTYNYSFSLTPTIAPKVYIFESDIQDSKVVGFTKYESTTHTLSGDFKTGSITIASQLPDMSRIVIDSQINIKTNNHFPHKDIDGTPLTPYIISFVEAQNVLASEIESLASVPGVYMLDPARIDSNLKTGQKNKIQGQLDTLGINVDISGYSTLQEVVTAVIQSWKPEFTWPNKNPDDYA